MSCDCQAAFPICIVQGVTYIQPFYYFDENNNPVNLTDCTAQMQARDTINASGDPILDWTTENGNIIIDPEVGLVMLKASAAATTDLAQTTSAVYSLLLTFPSGVVEELSYGPLTISGQPTR